jgi:hypothetical protein
LRVSTDLRAIQSKPRCCVAKFDVALQRDGLDLPKTPRNSVRGTKYCPKH